MRASWWSLAMLPVATSALALPPPADQAYNARVYDRAWSIVGRRYWDRAMHGLDWPAERDRFARDAREATDRPALYRAINRLLARLDDSHVYAIGPERLPPAYAKMGGESGFGFDAYRSGDGWLIHRVTPGGPAAAAGIRIGWLLRSVDGRAPDEGDRFGVGDHARLLLEDEHGGRHEVKLEGVTLPARASRRVRSLPGGILLLSFDQFASGEAAWIAGALGREPALRGVILDLRDNDGGEADVLDRVAGLFVADRQVVLRLSARRTRDERSRGAVRWRGPLAVLVGPRSASAAEALAAFLDESGRAVTVGERTAGALTAGVEHRLPDGGRLIVAENDVHTPGGTRLEGRGFLPRHLVRPTLGQLRADQDPVLDAATGLLGVMSTGPRGDVSTSWSPPSER